MAQPFRTLTVRGKQGSLETIAEIVSAHQVVGIVVGLPRNMDGSCGPAYEAAQELMSGVRRATGVPVMGWDERLTTVQAERILVEAGVGRAKRRRGGAIDRIAAALILESFLAALNLEGS